MSKRTVNQTNYQIIQTGGKLDMSNQGTSAVQSALGYPGAQQQLEKLFLKHFGQQRLNNLRRNNNKG